MKTLFESEEPPPLAIRFEGYAIAFQADCLNETSEWEIDTDTICETREAAEQLMADWADTGKWKIVKVVIESIEDVTIEGNVSK